jgi:hypothetical protein
MTNDVELRVVGDIKFLPFISGFHEDILKLDAKIHEKAPRLTDSEQDALFSKYK